MSDAPRKYKYNNKYNEYNNMMITGATNNPDDAIHSKKYDHIIVVGW